MSGHSKWSQIKRQKGVADIKRGLTFTKIANAITIAVKQGGGVSNPDDNFRLRLAIDKARTVNMPKDNIERAIQRASGKLAGEMDEVMYEGFGPLKTAIIVEAVTDNKLRTNSLVKGIFDKNGGILGQPGSVSYLFKNIGKITLAKDSKTLDEVFMTAAELGAEDVEEGEIEYFIYTSPKDLNKVRIALSEKGLTGIQSAELIFKPVVTVEIEKEEEITKVMDFIEKLEELDDVQKVYSNIMV